VPPLEIIKIRVKENFIPTDGPYSGSVDMSRRKAEVKKQPNGRMIIVAYPKKNEMIPESHETRELEALCDLTQRSAKMRGILGGPAETR
jgi:hypothetical protein